MNNLSDNLRSQRLIFILSGIIALIGICVLLYHTRNGPGITGDSVSYVMGAENMLAGRGYSRTAGRGEAVPITGFPPGYSTALMLFSWSNGDMFQAGRILNALLFGFNIFFSGFLLWKYTANKLTAILGSLLILLSEDLIHAHAWVMSEGLFISLSLLGIYVFVRYMQDGGAARLVGAALLFAAATLTRYVGVSLIGAAGLLLLFQSEKSILHRLRNLIIVGVFSFLPVLIWLLRNASLEGTATNREVAFHPPSSALLITFLGSINAWVFPLRLGLPDWLRAVITFSLLAIIPLFLFYRLSVRRSAQTGVQGVSSLNSLPTLLLVYMPIYTFVLIANTTFLDAGTSLAGAARYLTPLFVVAVIYTLSLYDQYFKSRPDIPGWVRSLFIGLGAAILILYTIRAVQFVTNPGEAFRYSDSKRNMPDVVEALEGIDPEAILISNDIQLVYVLSRRPAYLFPLLFDVYRQVERDDFYEQVEITQGRLNQGAVLILFKPIKSEQEETLTLLDVVPTASFHEATFYIAN